MNAAHWHVMLNHFPVTGLLLGLLLWGLALKTKRPELDRLLWFWFLMMGVLVVPVYLTGLNSHEVLHDLPGISHAQIDLHEEWGRYTLFALLALAGLSVVAIIRPRPIIQKVFPALVLVTFGVALYTSHLGGLIRHPEIQPDFVPSSEQHGSHAENEEAHLETTPHHHNHPHNMGTEHHHQGE
jgi:hypothetical protein